MTLYVDPTWVAHATAPVPPSVSPVDAVRAAYNEAAVKVLKAGRTPALIEVTVRVSPLAPPKQP